MQAQNTDVSEKGTTKNRKNYRKPQLVVYGGVAEKTLLNKIGPDPDSPFGGRMGHNFS